MDDKLKVFEYLDMLTRMCRSKGDSASLRIEEEEINSNIHDIDSEIEEIRYSSDAETYDTSAEMADRNIEIICKKLINSLRSELKEKQLDLDTLLTKEEELNKKNNSLQANKKSIEEIISSISSRLANIKGRELTQKYKTKFNRNQHKLDELEIKIKEASKEYEELQKEIEKLSTEIQELKDKISIKQNLLLETHKNLESRENYIDQNKKKRNNKRVDSLVEKKDSLLTRLKEIKSDPKYLESKIKEILNSTQNKYDAKDYLLDLLKMALNQPYMDVPADSALDEELLRATQARDTFANEIDHKSYSVMDSESPIQIRINYLELRINEWKKELKKVEEEITKIDSDEQFNFENISENMDKIMAELEKDVKEYQKVYDLEPEINMASKAKYKASLDEKIEQLDMAEKIAEEFRKEEAELIFKAENTLRDKHNELTESISRATEEINEIKRKLVSKKTGLIDISALNKDKEHLKELAKVVIDIKHRRQFSDTPIQIAAKLEKILNFELIRYLNDEEPNYNQDINYEDIAKKEQDDDEANESSSATDINTSLEITETNSKKDNDDKNNNSDKTDDTTLTANEESEKEIVTDEKSEPIIEEKEEELAPQTEDETKQTEDTPEELETLDILEDINKPLDTESDSALKLIEEAQNFLINTMFKSEPNQPENNNQALNNEQLSAELDKYINNLTTDK